MEQQLDEQHHNPAPPALAFANIQLSLQQLKWFTIGVPILFLLVVVLIGYFLTTEFIFSWFGLLLLVGITTCMILGFSELVFAIVAGIQARQLQQTRELLALHEAGLEITQELELETVLQRVVNRAASLVGARYGALSLLTTNTPERRIANFITTGMSAEEQALIGNPPQGYGLLGVILDEGECLRLDELSTHPASCGFPPNHPPMHSLLAVPIIARGTLHGHLYLTEKIDATSFTADDEATLNRFATQAALAISNARLHHLAREVAISEERALLAREMHDSVAQVLGYVNTKAQAAQGFLAQGQADRANTQITQLANAARESYADVREHILGLRMTTDPTTGGGLLPTLQRYLGSWQEQSGVTVDLVMQPDESVFRNLPPRIELQLLRIIQESLSNVRKHAAAKQAQITIIKEATTIEIRISDNGVGFDPAALGRADFPRFGLTGMRERAAVIGADLDITSTPGHGTEVCVLLKTS